jgi:hypothetical protein
MPSQNPKHNKKPEQTQPMGIRHESLKCNVQDCSEMGAHSLTYSNLEGYTSKLGFKFNVDTAKVKKIELCKKHFKMYKKLKDKDERYTKFKDFGPGGKSPRPDKIQKFME